MDKKRVSTNFTSSKPNFQHYCYELVETENLAWFDRDLAVSGIDDELGR